jgi:hypothetical protein
MKRTPLSTNQPIWLGCEARAASLGVAVLNDGHRAEEVPSGRTPDERAVNLERFGA